jgi:hypothetical protein
VVESVQMDEVVTASMGINFEPQKTVFTEHTSPPATKPVSKPQVVDIKGLFSIDKTPKIEPSQQVVDDSPNQYPNDFEDLLNSPYGEVEQVNLKNLFSE